MNSILSMVLKSNSNIVFSNSYALYVPFDNPHERYTFTSKGKLMMQKTLEGKRFPRNKSFSPKILIFF